MSDLSKKDKKDKKEKKEKKEKKQEEIAPVVEEQNEVVVEEGKKSKKDKKEKKRQATEEAVVEEEAEEVVVESKKDKKEKKDKKNKKSKTEDAVDAESQSFVQLAQPNVAPPSKDLIEKFYADNFVKVTANVEDDADSNILPALTFAQSNFPADVLKPCAAFEKPSPIQAASWPVLQRGLDIISIAETGSGKTLGFLLPALCHIKRVGPPKKKGTPTVLVLAPTRELAIQIQQVAYEVEKHVKFSSVCVYGGMERRDQMKAMNDKIDIITATPGRLLGMLRDQLLDLSNVSYFVLDEADRLLDMGFEQDIRDISSHVKPLGKRQTVLFSATWPESVMRFASTLIREKAHYRIDIGKGSDQGGDQLQANARIKQTVFVVDYQEKKDKLKELITNKIGRKGIKCIVFVLYKKEVPQIEDFLARLNCKVAGISSDYTQQERIKALNSFKEGTVDFLVATDVAARGLDIPNVEHVINFTFPLTIEDYVHRIGRTGRAGKKGNAWTFFNGKEDKQHAGSLQLIMKKADQEIPEELAKFGMVIKKKADAMYGNYGPKGNVDVTKKKHIKFDD